MFWLWMLGLTLVAMALPETAFAATSGPARVIDGDTVDISGKRIRLHGVDTLAECLQVAFDTGAKRILLPMSSVCDIQIIPRELFANF